MQDKELFYAKYFEALKILDEIPEPYLKMIEEEVYAINYQKKMHLLK